jgi:hypothetical protein
MLLPAFCKGKNTQLWQLRFGLQWRGWNTTKYATPSGRCAPIMQRMQLLPARFVFKSSSAHAGHAIHRLFVMAAHYLSPSTKFDDVVKQRTTELDDITCDDSRRRLEKAAVRLLHVLLGLSNVPRPVPVRWPFVFPRATSVITS